MTSVPSVIGATENTLRSLLLRTLAASPIDDYHAWVAMNYLGTESGPQQAVAGLGHVLQEDIADISTVLEGLAGRGLLRGEAPNYTITPLGEDALRLVRSQVQSVTARLMDGIVERDVATTVRTLDQIRARAERELGRAAPG